MRLTPFCGRCAWQVAKDGVRVTSILPGTVATELWGLTDEADIAERVAKCEVLRAEDVADIAEFVLTQPPHVAIRELVVLPPRSGHLTFRNHRQATV